MSTAIFRFYEELNDLLPRDRQKKDFEVTFQGKRSIKDMIESLGVPHTEVDLILVNGESVDFRYLLCPGDRVSVYPVFERLDIAEVTRLRNLPLRRTRFIADNNLGQVVKLMRALGFDVEFNPDLHPGRIVEISKREKRIILTMSRKLLKRKEVTHGILIRPGEAEKEVRRILESLHIKSRVKPFSRCLVCNNPLEPVSKADILDRIPPKVRARCHAFSICRPCHRIYWEGTHVEAMKKRIQEVLAEA